MINNKINTFLLFLFSSSMLLSVEVSAKEENKAITKKSDWNIELFSAEKANGIPFCAISKDFENGYTVFISMNPMHDAKMILHSRDNLYVTGQKYNLSLEVDSEKKLFSSLSPIENDFDLRIGEGDSIYSKLINSNSFNIFIDQKKVEFTSSSMPRAMQDLNACVEGQAMVEETLLQESTSSGADLKEMSKVDLIKKYNENQALIMGEELTEAPKEAIISLSIDEKELLESLKKKISILEQEKEALRTEVENQRGQSLTTLKGTLDASSDAQSCKNKIGILEKKVLSLQEQSQRLSSVAQQLPQSTENVKKSPPEDKVSSDKLMQDLLRAQSVEAALKKENLKLLEENAHLKDEKSKLENKVSKDRSVPVVSPSDEIFKENEILKAELQKAKLKIQSLENKLDTEKSKSLNAELKSETACAPVSCPKTETFSGPEELKKKIEELRVINKAYERQLSECQ